MFGKGGCDVPPWGGGASLYNKGKGEGGKVLATDNITFPLASGSQNKGTTGKYDNFINWLEKSPP